MNAERFLMLRRQHDLQLHDKVSMVGTSGVTYEERNHLMSPPNTPNPQSTVNISEMAFRIFDACDGRGIHALPDSTPHKVSICDTAWNQLWEVLRRKWLLRVKGNKNIQ